jgi:aminopeptidase N
VVLDFRDGSIAHVTVNGTPAEAQTANGHLIIPGRYFTAGRNRIAVDFVSGIATSGRAITRYLDRDDGAQYIYSLFVPMDPSQAFPCFDQPDLKARFHLDITAPDNWTVVSNTRLESTAPASRLPTCRPVVNRPRGGKQPPRSLTSCPTGPFELINPQLG